MDDFENNRIERSDSGIAESNPSAETSANGENLNAGSNCCGGSKAGTNNGNPNSGTARPIPVMPFNMPQRKETAPGCFSKAAMFLFYLTAIFLFLFAFIGIFFAIFCTTIRGVAEMYATEEKAIPVLEEDYSGNPKGQWKIAIIPVKGLITGSEKSFLRKAIQVAEEDDTLCAIVLRVNSPGGTVSGSDSYYQLLKDLKTEKKIPIVVSMADMATSGAYYISMAADSIYAERSTWTGSIGVIVHMYNAAQLAEKIGVSSNCITSGDMKGMGDPLKPMSKEEKAVWDNLVAEGYSQFLQVVREGRACFREGDGPEKLKKIADGRIYGATEAKKLKLIDEIGFLDDAVNKAIELSKKNKQDINVVKYVKEESFIDTLLGSTNPEDEKTMLKKAAGLFTPSPYYLCPRALPMD